VRKRFGQTWAKMPFLVVLLVSCSGATSVDDETANTGEPQPSTTTINIVVPGPESDPSDDCSLVESDIALDRVLDDVYQPVELLAGRRDRVVLYESPDEPMNWDVGDSHGFLGFCFTVVEKGSIDTNLALSSDGSYFALVNIEELDGRVLFIELAGSDLAVYASENWDLPPEQRRYFNLFPHTVDGVQVWSAAAYSDFRAIG